VAAVVQNQANTILGAILAQNSCEATSGIHTRLTSTVPTATAAGTELAGGGGYTTGGTVTTWNAPSAGATSNITVLTWTNSSGGTWSIAGLELWDEAGTPLRWLFGTFGTTLSIAVSNSLSVAASAIEITLT
jgi:hypothetical protein